MSNVAAVGDKGTVMFDSGIRTGADVFKVDCKVEPRADIKALALGAKAVLVGRLYGESCKHSLMSHPFRVDRTTRQSRRDVSPGCADSTPVYGMAIAGESGVRHVMKSLLADFDILMNCAGVNTVKEIDRSHLSESFGCPLPNTRRRSSVSSRGRWRALMYFAGLIEGIGAMQGNRSLY